MAFRSNPFLLEYDAGDSNWTVVADITSWPDFGGDTNALDATSGKDVARVHVDSGVRKSQRLIFDALFDKTKMTTINSLTGIQDFRLHFGTAGANLKVTWSGEISAHALGSGVADIVKMQVVIFPTTEIIYA